MRRQAIINWGISSFFGWGVYGLNLARAWSRDPEIEPLAALPVREQDLAVDPLVRHALQPFLERSAAFQGQLARRPGELLQADAAVLHALGGDLAPGPAAHAVQLTGRPTVGVAFFETALLAPEAVARARQLDLVVAGSTWNARVLEAHGIGNARTVLQGIDPALFHPAPRRGLMRDRFLVFSGGKLELRKGQDLVLAAFRRFAERCPEAVLVTAWHSPWPRLARTLDARGIAAPVVFAPDGRVDVPAWAAACGVPPRRIVDLGAVPNALLPPVLREMDVAVFPNRCEGGTNLVAMECMACGVPVVLSANTGHLDLIAGESCFALDRQRPMAGLAAGCHDVPGWGESDVEEIVAALERARTERAEAERCARNGLALVQRLTWDATAAAMKAMLLGRS
jgi:glycosyltransferase involved in cell wall biosynthesis